MNKVLKLSKLDNEKLKDVGDLVEIGSLTATNIRVTSRLSEDNPINRMYELLTKLIQEQGVKVVAGNDKISISDVYITNETEDLIVKECKTYLKKRGYTGKRLESQLAWVALETPATLGLKVNKKLTEETAKLEKLAGLKNGKIYARVNALKEAKKVKKTKSN